MTTQDQTPEKVFAFWTYDSFPYVLGAAGYQIGETTMRLDNYGQWGMASMFAFEPVSKGVETKRKLEELRVEYERKCAELKREYMGKALEVLPSLALTRTYGGKIR